MPEVALHALHVNVVGDGHGRERVSQIVERGDPALGAGKPQVLGQHAPLLAYVVGVLVAALDGAHHVEARKLVGVEPHARRRKVPAHESTALFKRRHERFGDGQTPV